MFFLARHTSTWSKVAIVLLTSLSFPCLHCFSFPLFKEETSNIIILMKHFTTAITRVHWKAYKMPCFKHLRVSVSVFSFRRVAFLCSTPACFPSFTLADTTILFLWNHFYIPEYNELVYHTTEDKVFIILWHKHTWGITCSAKIKAEVTKVWTKPYLCCWRQEKLFSLQ